MRWRNCLDSFKYFFLNNFIHFILFQNFKNFSPFPSIYTCLNVGPLKYLSVIMSEIPRAQSSIILKKRSQIYHFVDL